MREQRLNTLRVCFLGLPQIFCDEELVSHQMSSKALGLLAYLMMGSSNGYTRRKLASLFWGKTGEKQANFNLRRTLWSLRKCINPAGAPSDTFISHKGRHYSFNRSNDYWLDVNILERAVETHSQVRNSKTVHSTANSPTASATLRDLRKASRLYRGNLLEGCNPRGCPEFIDWLVLERDRLEQQYVRSLRLLAIESAIQRDYQQAIADYQRILKVDPLDEPTHCDLIAAYYAMGRRNRAIEHYHGFRRMLRQRLDLEPLTETQTLYQDIRDSNLSVDIQSHWQNKPRDIN